MDRTSAAAARIREIEAQQDELLRQLEELERRTADVLARHLPAPPSVVVMADPALAPADAL